MSFYERVASASRYADSTARVYSEPFNNDELES